MASSKDAKGKGDSLAVMSPRHIFGLKGDAKSNIWYADENTVVYPCGAYTVLYNCETKEQRFVLSAESPNFVSEGISALGLTPSKRFVAIAERGARPLVHMYDLAKSAPRAKKPLSFPELGSREIVSLAFSADSKFCLTQGGAPEWTLVSWQWEKGKVVASAKVSNASGAPIHQADFCPADSSIVCISGNGIFKFLKITDGQLKPVQAAAKRDPMNYLCHAWLDGDRVIVAADNGNLQLYEGMDYKLTLAAPGGDAGGSIDSIHPFSNGFVCAGAGGVVYVYETSDDPREFYTLQKRFPIRDNLCRITSLAISPSEDSLACSLENHQLFVLGLSNADILKEDAMNFEPLTTSTHAPGDGGLPHVTGLDTCIRKPLVATCGLDKCVRVWNYETKEVDLARSFGEEAYSLAFHPSGLYLLVGFMDKLRMMSLLMGDIRTTRELNIKACREVRFAHGGQQFAAMNNNTVHVYQTYSAELVATLRGHNGKVRSLAWSGNDRHIFTSGSDGAIIQWDALTGTKIGDFNSPRVNFCCAVPLLTGHGKQVPLVFACGSDDVLREVFIGGRDKHEAAVAAISSGSAAVAAAAAAGGGGGGDVEMESDQPLGQLAVAPSGKLLFVSTASAERNASIRVYALPLEKGAAHLCEVSCHAAPITRLRTTHDGALLFASSEDGSMSVFDVRDPTHAKLAKSRDREQALPFAEEILVTKSDLEQKTSLMAELTEKVNELTLHNEQQLRSKDNNYRKQTAEVSERFRAELGEDSSRYADLVAQKRTMEADYRAKIAAQELAHSERKQAMEASYDAKVEVEQKRFGDLQQEKEDQNVRWNDKNGMMMEAHQQYLGQKTAEYDLKLQEEVERKRRVDEEIERLKIQDGGLQSALEEDADLEVARLRRENEAKLHAEREATLRLKGENAIMKKKYVKLQEEIKAGVEDINKLKNAEKDLYEQIKGLEKDIQGHKKEIREREETIQDKEKRIYDLKKKNQELEKFKFVLDYKIKELKRQIEPREKEITDMRQQIEDMDHELEQYHKSNAALDLMIGELRLKMDGMQHEIDDQRDALADGSAATNRFRTDLREAVQHVADPKALKVAMTSLYKKYVQDQKVGDSGADADLQREYNRQREYLEKSVECLKRKLAKDTKMHHVENARLMRENVSLLREINDLRRSKKWVDSEKAAAAAAAGGRGVDPVAQEEAWREVDMQQETIFDLTERMQQLQQEMGIDMDRGPESELGQVIPG